MANEGVAIQIVLWQGSVTGKRSVDSPKWPGTGLAFPREHLPDDDMRAELEKPGVYVLSGVGEESGRPCLYIGQGDPVRRRLGEQGRKKSFWTTAYAFTGSKLNSAHLDYVEASLIDLAQRAKLSDLDLDNRHGKTRPTLARHDRLFAESFLEGVILCLPLLGLHSLVEVPAAITKGPEGDVFHITALGCEAKGRLVDGGMLVLEGSRARGEEVPSARPALRALREELEGAGVLRRDGESLLFTQAYRFGSPSTAASVVMGRAANGREEWKDGQEVTLNERELGTSLS